MNLSLDAATRSYVLHIAAAKFKGNRSKAARYLIAKASVSIESEP